MCYPPFFAHCGMEPRRRKSDLDGLFSQTGIRVEGKPRLPFSAKSHGKPAHPCFFKFFCLRQVCENQTAEENQGRDLKAASESAGVVPKPFLACGIWAAQKQALFRPAQ